ncbi:MAG: GAF domain-containing protein [Polyangiaceae bacterium]
MHLPHGDGGEGVRAKSCRHLWVRNATEFSNRYRLQESLIGQCAFEKRRILLSEVPKDIIAFRLEWASRVPCSCVIVLPVLFEGEAKAVIELASFSAFSPIHLTFLYQLMGSVGVILNMISTSMRMEEAAATAQEVQCGAWCSSCRAQ